MGGTPMLRWRVSPVLVEDMGGMSMLRCQSSVTSSRMKLWSTLLLLALVLLAFAPLFRAEFVRLDDPYTLHQNPRMNPPSWANVRSYWREWRSGADGLYVPVTYMLWSALAAVARVEPA